MDDYIRARHNATKLPDGEYNLDAGECNPEFFRWFVKLLKKYSFPLVMWEPFAGHTRRSLNLDYSATIPGAVLVSYDIKPFDSRVLCVDSISRGPWFRPYGLFFHPPYFGSTKFSSESGEISLRLNIEDYLNDLKKVVFLTNLQIDGIACAIGRSYRHGGEIVNLPRLFLEIFITNGYVLEEMWMSEPDEAMILRRDK